MELKKSKKANLENKRTLFLELGFVLALALVLLGFQWTKTELESGSLGTLPDLTGEEEIIPITRQELQKPITPPKPQAVVLELNIVDDDVVLDEDLLIDDFEVSQDDIIEIMTVEEEEEDDDFIFVIVEDEPLFQGQDREGFRRYIQSTLKYPQTAMENSISGTVYVNFVVDKQGAMVDIEIVRGVDRSLDNEVIRALKAAPKWTPGKQRGKPVKVTMTIPIRFTLN